VAAAVAVAAMAAVVAAAVMRAAAVIWAAVVAVVIWVAVIWAAVAAEDATATSSLEPAPVVLGVAAVVAVAVPAGYGHREAGSTAAVLSLCRHPVSPSKLNRQRRLLKQKTGVVATGV
jgi:hypothetical protein